MTRLRFANRSQTCQADRSGGSRTRRSGCHTPRDGTRHRRRQLYRAGRSRPRIPILRLAHRARIDKQHAIDALRVWLVRVAKYQHVRFTAGGQPLKAVERPVFEQVLVHPPWAAVHKPEPTRVGLEPDLWLQRTKNRLELCPHRLPRPHQREVAQSLVVRIAVRTAAFVPIEPHAVVVVPHDRGNRVALNPVDDLVWKRCVPDQSLMIATLMKRLRRARSHSVRVGRPLGPRLRAACVNHWKSQVAANAPAMSPPRFQHVFFHKLRSRIANTLPDASAAASFSLASVHVRPLVYGAARRMRKSTNATLLSTLRVA